MNSLSALTNIGDPPKTKAEDKPISGFVEAANSNLRVSSIACFDKPLQPTDRSGETIPDKWNVRVCFDGGPDSTFTCSDADVALHAYGKIRKAVSNAL